MSWPPDSLLGSLDETDQEALLGLGSPSEYLTDETLMRQGDPDTHVVLLRSGTVKVSATSEKGDLTLLAVRAAGDIVGELAAIRCGPRSATVTACTKVEGRRITQGDFQAFLAEHAQVALAVTRMVGGRLVAANIRRVEFGSYPVKSRLARVLADFGRWHGRQTSGGLEIDVKLTQVELAALTGSRYAAVAKAFRELRDAALVKVVYGRITILRPADLDDAAG